MACERNRILEIVQYFESLGIEVNIGKNKARGNRGFFKVKNECFRIDIAKNQSEEVVLRTLVHEFAHFVHYNYDKKLKSLNFIIDDNDIELQEELIKLTVDSIPKASIKPLFDYKEELETRLKNIPKWSFERPYYEKALRSTNRKISRMNNYYNSPTELFARSIESYITDNEKFTQRAPKLLKSFNESSLPLIENLKKIVLQNC